jgi:hypothetical protein
MLLAAALSAVPIASSAQSVPRAVLGRTEAQLPDPFDNVTAVRELSDGRVIVADRSAKTVTVADFRSGSATAIGREGQGRGWREPLPGRNWVSLADGRNSKKRAVRTSNSDLKGIDRE